MTSNKVFVTYERSTCSKSNPLADTCFRVSSFISQSAYGPDRGLFESVQAHLKFFPFENITKVMKFWNSFGSKTRLNSVTLEHINVTGSCYFKTCFNSLTVFQVAIILFVFNF